MVRRFDFAGTAGDVFAAMDALARDLNPRAQPAPTASLAALRDWSAALEARDRDAARAALERATAADPDFGAAWVLRVQQAAAAGDRDGALRLLGEARARPGLRPAAEKARLELLAADLSGDPAARRTALAAIVAAAPADLGALRALADAESNARRFPEALAQLEALRKLAPDDPAILNAIGYAKAFAGDLPGAKAALEAYARAPGQEPNALDSLGEVHFLHGRFREAAGYFSQVQAKAPGFLGGSPLRKAALALWLAGERGAADKEFDAYALARGQDPRLEIDRAHWERMTGRPAEAASRLERLAAGGGDLAAIAAATLSFWRLEDRDAAGAPAAARLAQRKAQSPPAQSAALLVRLIAEPDVPAEALFGNPQQAGLRSAVELNRALLAGKFAAALPELERGFRASPPSADATPRTLYAWALVETGRLKDAEPLLRLYPVPPPGAETAVGFAPYPRFGELRRKVFGN
jgi:Tfp pilus assembly protein PilF